MRHSHEALAVERSPGAVLRPSAPKVSSVSPGSSFRPSVSTAAPMAGSRCPRARTSLWRRHSRPEHLFGRCSKSMSQRQEQPQENHKEGRRPFRYLWGSNPAHRFRGLRPKAEWHPFAHEFFLIFLNSDSARGAKIHGCDEAGTGRDEPGRIRDENRAGGVTRNGSSAIVIGDE